MASFRASAGYHIAITFAAVLAWTILLLGACAFFFTRGEFRQARDREIALELDRLAHVNSRAALIRELQGDTPGGQYDYALFEANGRHLAGALDIGFPPDGFQYLRVGEEAMMRGRVATVGNGDRLVVATSYDAMDRIELILLQFFLGAFVAVLAISAVGGLLLAWYLRARLKPIEATANAIQTGDIEWRVAVGARGDEFDKAGVAMNLMLDRIAGLMENLRQVSSDIAHDLRKPLIRLLHQTDRLGRVDGAEQRVLELGDEMIALFSAILRIAEIEGGGLERSFVPVDLSTLMMEMVESFEPAFVDGDHTIEWNIEPNVGVVGNRELLAQVATNLLDNGLIHTPQGTTVRFGLAALDNTAMLWIEDNGPGVSQEDRAKLLQRFFRAESSRTTAGNGLGLNLVAAVVRAHKGTIAVLDANPGLRIELKIPRMEDSRLGAQVAEGNCVASGRSGS